jgi:cytochrome c oxidase cbb3-type subunit 3
MKRLIYLVPVLILAGNALAQDKAGQVAESPVSGNLYMNILVVVLLITALLALIAALVMMKSVKLVVKEYTNPQPRVETVPEPLMEYEEWAALEKAKRSIWTKLMGLKPLSEEKDIMLEHDFDGITELDNPTPDWFMWLFYATICFAFLYLMNYHVLKYGKLQEEEYTIEMRNAKAEQNAYLAKSANNIDEKSVKESKEADVISEGRAVFTSHCVPCHGDKAQGMVGPNLTDEYWLHGGKINNVFKTIKYGVPEKGMITWEKTLSPKEISAVANYVLSLKGTNPPNAKAPQGDKEG